MKTKQIVGLVMSVLGGFGAVYFGMAVINAHKVNRFWGMKMADPTTYTVFTVIFIAILIVGILFIVANGEKKSQ